MEPKYTQKGLPVINEITLEALVDRYAGRKNQSGGTDWGNT